MVIEALVNGEFLTRQEVLEDYLLSIEGATWKENVQARRKIVELFLEDFQKKMDKIFRQEHRVQYCLVFQSKMNAYAENNGGRDQVIDDQTAEDDHRTAEGWSGTPEG